MVGVRRVLILPDVASVSPGLDHVFRDPAIDRLRIGGNLCDVRPLYVPVQVINDPDLLQMCGEKVVHGSEGAIQ